MEATTDSQWGSDFEHMLARVSPLDRDGDGQPSSTPFSYAPVGLRIAARLIDGLVAAAFIGVPAGIVRHHSPTVPRACRTFNGRLYGCQQLTPEAFDHLLRITGILTLVGFLLLQWIPMANSGRTFGRWMFGIRVVDEHTGRPIGVIRSLLRGVSSIVSVGILGVGCLSIPSHPKRQSWHDRLAKSVVINDG